MATVIVRDVPVHSREAGQGSSVVLLHCSTGSGGQWRQLMERLSARYHLLAPDLHGYGRTGRWPAGRTDLIGDEMAIAEAMLSRSDRRVHLVGHSYGGHIAARTALRHSNRIASLTLIEPTLFYLLPEAGELPAYAEVHALAAATIEDVEAGRGDQAAERFLDYWIGSG